MQSNGFVIYRILKDYQSLISNLLKLGDLKILKYVFKSIYNFSDVPLSWKNKFAMKDSRNGILLEPIHTRVRLCDRNFYIYSINLFNSLPIIVKNEKSFVNLMLCQTFVG
jgi:hypothetical protein